MTSRTVSRSVAAVLAGATLGGAAGGAAVALLTDDDPAPVVRTVAPASSGTATATSAESATSAGALSAGAIYRRSSASVVHISAQVQSAGSSPFDPSGGSSGVATGSGFVISSDGEIATNAHVVDGATSIAVKLQDGTKRSAKLVGRDDSTDVALLRIDASGLALQPLRFADSSKVRVGDATAAIGNPFGLDGTLTTGVVSAVQRTIEAPDGFSISDAIQTDAALNPGNSGGPLLDAQGRVIGINSQIYTGSSAGPDGSSSGGNTGLGFAVPSNTVVRVVDQLRADGSAEHAYLGVSSTSVDDLQSAPAGASIGASLEAVRAGGPAAKAGLRRGDVVVAAGDRRVATSEDLTAAVDARRPGDRVTLTVVRDGAQRSVAVQLGSRPDAAA